MPFLPVHRWLVPPVQPFVATRAARQRNAESVIALLLSLLSSVSPTALPTAPYLTVVGSVPSPATRDSREGHERRSVAWTLTPSCLQRGNVGGRDGRGLPRAVRSPSEPLRRIQMDSGVSHLNVSLTRGRRGSLKTVFTAFEENDKPQRNRPEVYPLPASAAAFRRAKPAHTRPSCN